jgi:peroxiredoxin
MRKNWKLIMLILVIVIAAGGLIMDNRRSYGTKVNEKRSDTDLPVGTDIGQLAPDFSGETLDGEPISISDLKGEIVVVNIFASWCGPCRLEMPHLVNGYSQLKDQGVEFVGLNLRENRGAVSVFKEEYSIDFPLLLDPSGELTNDLYKPIGLPTTWFIDRQGIVQYIYAGAMTEAILLHIVEDVQAGRQPNPFRT